jgi:hypothetical protein
MTAIAISLLAVTAALFLLARTKKENLGGGYTFASYLVLIGALVITGFSISRMVCKSRCESGGCAPEQHCMMTGKPCGEQMKDCCRSMGHEGAAMQDSARTDGNEVGDKVEEKPLTEGKGAVK